MSHVLGEESGQCRIEQNGATVRTKVDEVRYGTAGLGRQAIKTEDGKSAGSRC